MRNEDSGIVDTLKFILYLILSVMIIIAIGSAFPYQLNLTDGTIIDLNSSQNATNNFTIYIIHQNVSYYNVTNITYQNTTYLNTTCLNCTNYYNNTYNDSYFNYGYNKSDLDGTFLKLSDYNSWKSGLTYATKDELNNVNSTISAKSNEVSTTWIWLSILGVFLIEFGIISFIIYMARSGE